MDTAQWPQGIGVVKTMDGTRTILSTDDERKAKPQKDQALNCPRCNSTNTKFCYYNNYSLSQPRYFCKTCKRYWTEGGSLRNVPVGGGSRKNKRSSTSSTSQNPKIHQGHDLNLLYPSTDHHQDYNTTLPKFNELPPDPFSSMELLKSQEDHNIITLRGLSSSFMPMAVSDNSNTIYSSSGIPMQEFKPTLNFSLDGFENGYGSSLQGVQQNGGSGGGSARLLFPFEELKQVSSKSTGFDQNRSGNGDSNGYWNGMLGGGSW